MTKANRSAGHGQKQTHDGADRQGQQQDAESAGPEAGAAAEKEPAAGGPASDGADVGGSEGLAPGADAPASAAILQSEGDDADAVDVVQPAFSDQWNACLTLAFAGTGADYLTDWGDIPFVMAHFILSNPSAPDEAVLIHVKRTCKVVILGNEDQRRVQLAVQLFRTWLSGSNAIDRQNDEQHRRELAAANPAPRPAVDPDDLSFQVDRGPLNEMSDLGKALAGRKG